MQDARSQPAEPNWWTFERVALLALMFAAAVVLLQVQQQGREVSYGAGAREARLEELVKGIEASQALRHAEMKSQGERLEKRMEVLEVRMRGFTERLEKLDKEGP